MKKAKTSGITFLEHSLGAFNGSGYADKSDGASFYASYIAYCQMRHRYDHIEQARSNFGRVLDICDKLAKTGAEAGKITSQKNLDKFSRYYSKAGGVRRVELL